jgi:hypothetical protein
MTLEFYIAVGSLVLATILGLSLAWDNLNNEEAREYRLKLRRAYRAERCRRQGKKPLE